MHRLPRFYARPAALLLLALAALSIQCAHAQDAARQADLLLRQEQDRLRLEQERARQAQPPSGVDLSTVLPRPDASAAAGPCHNIAQILLKGADLMDQDDLNEVVGRFRNRCLAAPDIEQLMARATQHYIDRGFITTRAYLPAQDLSTGRLELVVLEGRIERLVVDNDPEHRVNLDTTVAAQAGDLLNIRDLEQAVDQINAAPGNKVKLDILPGSRPGLSIVRFINQPSKPWSLLLAADNQSVKATGRNGVSATLNVGGWLGLNEGLSLTYRTSLPHQPSASSDSASATLFLPSGYTTYSLSTAVSNYSMGLVTAQGANLQINGQSTTLSAGAERVLIRDQDSRHAATLTLSSVDSKNYLGGELLQVSSRRATSLGVGLKSTFVLGGGMAFVKPEVVLGLNDMGNLPDGVNASSDGPQAQFRKFGLALNYDKRFAWQSQDYGWTSAFIGQYSPDQLLSAQQILIGGFGTVRGFMVDSLTGDTGYYWRNELAWFKATEFAGTPTMLRVYAGLDQGRVTSHSPSGSNGSMAGWVMGVNAKVNATTVDLSLTEAIHVPTNMPREGAQVWLRVSFSL